MAEFNQDEPVCKHAEILNTLGFVQWHLRQTRKTPAEESNPNALATIERAQSIALAPAQRHTIFMNKRTREST